MKKGGHGGHRAGAGLSLGHWDAQGGRAAAGVAKAKREATAVSTGKKKAVVSASERWNAMGFTSKNPQNAHSEQPAAELRRSPRKEAAVPSSSNEALRPSRVDAVAENAIATLTSEQLLPAQHPLGSGWMRE